MSRRTGGEIWGDKPPKKPPPWVDRGRGNITADQVRSELVALQGQLNRLGLLDATQTVITHRGPEAVRLIRI